MKTNIEIDDDYEHDESVEYIVESILMSDDNSPEFQLLRDDYNCQLTLFCKCAHNSSCNNNAICCHAGGTTYNQEHGELVLEPSVVDRIPAIIECNDLCECQKDHCLNRRTQYGPRKHLEVFESPLYKSKGLRTNIEIPRGAFICEYAGELLTSAEAQRRLDLIDRNSLMNYILYFCEHTKPYSGNTKSELLEITIVDPSRRGNIGRYLNHSCQPNCHILAVRTNCPIPKIAIFAKRDIHANEELCFHYAGENHNEILSDGKPCLCASTNCSGFMPNTRF